MSRLGDLIVNHGRWFAGQSVRELLGMAVDCAQLNALRNELIELRAAAGQRPTCMCLGADWPHVPSSARCTPPVDRRREARVADPHAHACVSCSPDGVLPGPGCINCRQTGMDQTPCTALGHTRQCPHGCCGGPRRQDPDQATTDSARCSSPDGTP